MSKSIFVTGGTGFLGKALIDTFLRYTDDDLILLTRDKNRVPESWTDTSRVVALEGDLLHPGIFYDKESFNYAKSRVTDVLHSAASVSFREREREQTFKTNLNGTLNLIDVSRNFAVSPRFHYISTAYTCGKMGDPNVYFEVLNDDGGKNPYEDSKQQTERLVAQSGLEYTILRPSIIVGSDDGRYYDTKTIYAIANGIYLGKYSKLNKATGPELLQAAVCDVPIAGNAYAKKNMIPVDIVAQMTQRIVHSDTAQGEIYHLCGPENFEARHLIDVPACLLKIQGLHYEPYDAIKQQSFPACVKLMHKFTDEFVDYLTLSDPVFDMRNTAAVVGEELIDKIPKPQEDHFAKLYSTFFEKEHGLVLQ